MISRGIRFFPVILAALHADETDAHAGKLGGNDRTAATTEHKPEGAKEFGSELPDHRVHPRFSKTKESGASPYSTIGEIP